MDRNSGAYFRPVYAWAAVSFIVSLVGTFVSTGRPVYSLVIASGSAAMACLLWYRIYTIGERRPHKPRRVDDSRL